MPQIIQNQEKENVLSIKVVVLKTNGQLPNTKLIKLGLNIKMKLIQVLITNLVHIQNLFIQKIKNMVMELGLQIERVIQLVIQMTVEIKLHLRINIIANIMTMKRMHFFMQQKNLQKVKDFLYINLLENMASHLYMIIIPELS